MVEMDMSWEDSLKSCIERQAGILGCCCWRAVKGCCCCLRLLEMVMNVVRDMWMVVVVEDIESRY